jgi:SAM-dependent methyltransferase
MSETKEKQYNFLLSLKEEQGLTPLGLMTNQVWNDDPKRLLFLLSRYKFVAKMMSGKSRILEIGCGDAFGTRIVRQEVAEVCATDFDPVFVADVNERRNAKWNVDAHVHDFVAGPFERRFEGAYALDVLEHIPLASEDRFLRNILASLEPNGILILGIPSIESQPYASPPSREGHVNCKSLEAFRTVMLQHFFNVFMFSMNDEVVHTGFARMANYLIAVGVGQRS